MREQNTILGEVVWYLAGLMPILVVCLVWASMGDQPMLAQRIILIVVGAVIGGCALFAAGEWLRPTLPANAQQDQKAKGDPMASGKNSVSVSGSNNSVSIGHIGDVTINQAPQPELRISAAESSKNEDGTYTMSAEVEVVSPYPPGSLRLEAWAPGIVSLGAAPQRTGMSMTGHSGVRPDHAFTTLMQPFGKYVITVRTAAPTNVDLRYDFDK